jgi:thioredoxin-related protein
MSRLYRHRLLGVFAFGLAIIISLAPVGIAFATEPRATAEAVEWSHPAWFKKSLLDLRADLEEARDAGKMGLLLVFDTRGCRYCQAFGATTLARPEIVARLRADFDVIGLEVLSDDEVVDLQGRSLWAKDFAVQEKARFTPTLIFYGEGGRVLLRLVGYVPPERFSLVLDYLQGGWHEHQGLRDFLAVREAPSGTGEREQLREDPLLARSPQTLDRRQAAARPLLVLFERPNCPACERMHLRVLAEAPIRDLLSRFDAVQLDVTDARTRIVTPDGTKTSPAGWGERLGVIHSPALVFFDERGTEVVRIDSDLLIDDKGDAIREPNPGTVGNVEARLLYVLERGYLEVPQFQRWRSRKMRETGVSGISGAHR